MRGRGWSQLAYLGEMIAFGAALVVATLLTAILVFHPVAHYVFSSRTAGANTALMREMATLQARKDIGVSDWNTD